MKPTGTPIHVHIEVEIVHNVLLRAGVIQPQKPILRGSKHSPRTMYDVRTHSLRKYFRTQMATAGLNADFIDFFLGHKLSTYHDVQSLGVEKLRSIWTRRRRRRRSGRTCELSGTNC